MSQDNVIWNVFDPEAQWHETVRNLPHRDQSNVLTFVTFRLEDSMPKEVFNLWQSEIRDWLNRNGFASQSADDVLESKTVPAEKKRLLRKHREGRWHYHLDACHGECLLREPPVAAEVAKSILHFDGQKYDVERFVIMPNHVHVLIQIKTKFDLRKQFREIRGTDFFNSPKAKDVEMVLRKLEETQPGPKCDTNRHVPPIPARLSDDT